MSYYYTQDDEESVSEREKHSPKRQKKNKIKMTIPKMKNVYTQREKNISRLAVVMSMLSIDEEKSHKFLDSFAARLYMYVSSIS
jgi:hypothetical protein